MCLTGRTGGRQEAAGGVASREREGSRRVGGVVSLTELSRDRGHKKGAVYRESTILGRGIKDLSSRPQRQRAARCRAARCGAVRCSEV